MEEENAVHFLDLDAEGLAQLSQSMLLSLDAVEMKKVRGHFKALGRNPTQTELETVAQTWSEHCKHKTFTAEIEYDNGTGKVEKIDGLFSSLIRKATLDIKAKMGKKGDEWLVSLFKDNAGIVKFNEKYDFAFKAETHNHPSALDPFGGANTGVGGVIRDVLGAGLGAKPYFNTDVFCLAPPDFDPAKVPEGILAPKRILRGVVSGVRDYGNPMGIPTINGAFYFHENYLGAPLVFCGTGGFMPRGMHEKAAKVGDAIVTVGAETGRDGIHGATFSSIELDANACTGAVQIGNPIEERKVMDGLLLARDKRLYNFVTDCGAGGFSSAVGEMAESLGCEVWLDKAPLKYKGLKPWEIWVSESQERMILSVSQEKVAELIELFRRENVQAVVIGKITGTGRLVVKHNEDVICDLECDFLHRAVPKKKMAARKRKAKESADAASGKTAMAAKGKEKIAPPSDIAAELAKILSGWNTCSKEWTVRQYDHEVQAHNVIKSMNGKLMDGHGDASVLQPFVESYEGIAVANGLNPLYGTIDAYAMAASAINEALRNVVCVGGDPNETVLLDNFCAPSPKNQENLGDIVEECKACYDYSVAYMTPFVSGKDSLHNEFKLADRTIAIPPTLLISAAAKVPDVRKCVTADFKKAGNAIYLVGKTFEELGGSQYYYLVGGKACEGKGVAPKVDAAESKKIFEQMHSAINSGIVRACHDCSEGGLGVAVAEMCFGSELGAEISLGKVRYEGEQRDDFVLFAESNSRFVVEVEPSNAARFEEQLKGLPVARIGSVTSAGNARLAVAGLSGKPIIDSEISKLKSAWKSPMDW
jgi:phosphoribosylformylglycinamidine synthase subunit PurSL